MKGILNNGKDLMVQNVNTLSQIPHVSFVLNVYTLSVFESRLTLLNRYKIQVSVQSILILSYLAFCHSLSSTFLVTAMFTRIIFLLASCQKLSNPKNCSLFYFKPDFDRLLHVLMIGALIF